jgi:hypothetical protein
MEQVIKTDIRPSFVEFLKNIISDQKDEMEKIKKLQIRMGITTSTIVVVTSKV